MLDEGFNIDGTVGGHSCFSIPFILFFLTYKYRSTIAENKSVSTLFEEFKCAKYRQMVYYPLFFLRRFIYMCGICFLRTTLQLKSLATHHSLSLCVATSSQLDLDCLKVVVNSVNEFFLGMVFVITSLCLLDLSDEGIKIIGAILGIGTMLVVSINAVLSIVVVVLKINDKCKRKTNVSWGRRGHKETTIVGEVTSVEQCLIRA